MKHIDLHKVMNPAQAYIRDEQKRISSSEYERLYLFLINWIKEHYGNSEAEDPSYDIKKLTEDLLIYIKKGGD